MIQLLPPHNAPEVLLLPAHDYWGSIIRGMQDFAAAMSGAAYAALATTEAQSALRSILVLAEAERRLSRAVRISKKMFGGVI
jgi:hypothetical protein